MAPMDPTATTVRPPVRERAHRAALAGLAFAVLEIIAIVLFSRIPGPGATDQELADYFGDTTERRLIIAAGIYVVPFAGIAFMWFLAALRERTLHAAGIEDPLFSTVQLMSGILYVGMNFVAAAAAVATPLALEFADDTELEIAGVRQLIVLTQSLMMILAIRAGAVFVAAGTMRARRAGLLPTWFHVVSMIGVVVTLLWATYSEPLRLLIPIWVACVSVFVLRRLPNLARPTEA
jgi:hypothetical protein